MAALLGELGVSPEASITLIKWADKKWDKFSKRADWAERLSQLFSVYKEKYKPNVRLTKLRPMTVQQLKAETPDVEWAIEGLLAKYTYGLITGPTGVGKSTVAMQWGMTWAKGGEWNDFVFPKLRVLCSSLEMGPNEILYFTDKLTLQCELGEEDVFHILPVGESVSVLTQEGRDFYLQYVDDYDVFIFDTVSSSTHLPMLDERTAPGIVSFFGELTGMGKTILALGHDTKDAQQRGIQRAESMYGHRLLMDRSSMIMRLDQPDLDDDEHLSVLFPKRRLGRKIKGLVYLRDPDTLWMTKTAEEVNFGRNGKRQSSSREALKDAGFKDNQDEVF